MASTIENWLCSAVIRYPYLATGFSALRPVLKPGFPTLAVDSSWRLYWSEEGCAKLLQGGGQPAELILHEITHLLSDHFDRSEGKEHQVWLIAADMEINDDLIRHDLPVDGVFPPPGEEFKTAETYYDMLLQHAKLQHAKECGGCCGGGSGAGSPNDDELPPDFGSSEEYQEAIREAVANEVMAAKSRSDMPAYLVQWAEARLLRTPPLSLPRLARGIATALTRGREDYSYARENHRQQGGKVILPATVKNSRSLAVVIDTSGSMGSEGNWIASVLHGLRHYDCLLIDCDAAVHSIRKLKTWRDVMKCIGGGGTDMRPGVQAAVDRRLPVLILTDGETPWPDPWPRDCVAILPNGHVRRA